MGQGKRILPTARERVLRMRVLAQSNVDDGRAFNQNRPDQRPVDIEPDILIVGLCDRALRAADDGDYESHMEAVREIQRIAGEATQ